MTQNRVSYTLDSTLETVDSAERAAGQIATEAGFDEEEVMRISMAVREAAVNAVLHGNAYDPGKKVDLAFERTGDDLVITIRDQGKGHVRWQGEGRLPEITYEMDDADRTLFIKGAREMARIYFAAGAHTSFPLLNPGVEPARSLDQALKQLPDDLPAQRLNPYGSHPQSTCRMSESPRLGVCKPTGETHEVQNLYVADGSLFPTAIGVNPQITILALATGIARDMVRKGI